MAFPIIARQYPLYVYADVVFGDILTTATNFSVFSIPLDSVLTYIQLFIVTAWTAAGNYDVDIGDVDDTNRYTSTISELDATGLPTNPPAVDGHATVSAEPNVIMRPVFTTDATAGAARLIVSYVQSARSNETDG